MSVINFDVVGDNVIEYYVNQGWEIVANAPNPCPSPYVYFVIKKSFPTQLTKTQKSQIFNEAMEYVNKYEGE